MIQKYRTITIGKICNSEVCVWNYSKTQENVETEWHSKYISSFIIIIIYLELSYLLVFFALSLFQGTNIQKPYSVFEGIDLSLSIAVSTLRRLCAVYGR